MVKAARVCEKYLKKINTVPSIWRENMFGYLSLYITCSSKLTLFLELRSRKTVSLLGKDNVRGQILEQISVEAIAYIDSMGKNDRNYER